LLITDGRAVAGGNGREKHYPDPEWNRRVIQIGGRSLYGAPNFRLAWGFNELQGNGGLRFPLHPFQWLLLKWSPGTDWGTKQSWYEPRIDDGQWVQSLANEWGEEWPSTGAYEIDHYFERGVRVCMPYIEDRLSHFVDRPKLPPREQRIKDARREIEAREQAVADRDHERFVSAAQPFGGQPFVGYGQKTAPIRSKAKIMPARFRRKFNEMRAGDMARYKRQGRKVTNV
jgi:hypothetical protein